MIIITAAAHRIIRCYYADNDRSGECSLPFHYWCKFTVKFDFGHLRNNYTRKSNRIYGKIKLSINNNNIRCKLICAHVGLPLYHCYVNPPLFSVSLKVLSSVCLNHNRSTLYAVDFFLIRTRLLLAKNRTERIVKKSPTFSSV